MRTFLNSFAQFRDAYLDAAEIYREAATKEDDPEMVDFYLNMAEEMEQAAESLQSDAPVIGIGPEIDMVQETLNTQLRQLEQLRQQFERQEQKKQEQKRKDCPPGLGMCATLAK